MPVQATPLYHNTLDERWYHDNGTPHVKIEGRFTVAMFFSTSRQALHDAL